jgi:hypothetical protein
MVAAGAALSCGIGLAADDVSLSIKDKDGFFNVEGSFQVQADTAVIWDVLTAYEQIPRFVGNLKKSHIEQDLGVYHFLLEQEFEGGFLFFTKRVRVVLDVHETWYQSIDFQDIDHKDFALYQGTWQVKPQPGQSQEISYHLKVKPNFSAPFEGDFMGGGAKDLLKSVRREILRRQTEKPKENTPLATTSL